MPNLTHVIATGRDPMLLREKIEQFQGRQAEDDGEHDVGRLCEGLRLGRGGCLTTQAAGDDEQDDGGEENESDEPNK